MNKLTLAMLITSTVVLASGCSTLTAGGSTQPVTVLTYTPEGKDLNEVKCEMTNDEGSWTIVTPGSSTVHRSNKDLFVTCRAKGFDAGQANVVSKTKGNMFGNIIFGGGIGAIVDHNNGTAYEYPSTIKIFMGRTQKIEEQAQNQTIEPNKENSQSN